MTVAGSLLMRQFRTGRGTLACVLEAEVVCRMGPLAGPACEQRCCEVSWSPSRRHQSQLEPLTGVPITRARPLQVAFSTGSNISVNICIGKGVCKCYGAEMGL